MYCTYPKVLWHQQQIVTIITKWVNICHMIVLIRITQVSNTNSLMIRTYVWHNYGVSMLGCKQYSSKYELHKIKIFHSHTSLAWRETKKKQFNNLKENKHGTKHHLTGIRWMDKSCKLPDRRQVEFLVYGRDASFPNYMWRKLNAQCSVMYKTSSCPIITNYYTKFLNLYKSNSGIAYV